ncbi:MAG: Periplasmic pH-dependent serine endoprotease DegQ precursor [Pseudomonadota bacterium]|jgi:S1-C subfamily serine protease
MKRGAFYSARPATVDRGGETDSRPVPAITGTQTKRTRPRLFRWSAPLAFVAGIVIAIASMIAWESWRPRPAAVTQEDIDAAVLHTLETRTLPSRAVRAALGIAPSVVRIQALSTDETAPAPYLEESGVGTGVVVMEDGTLLTNLHVVAGADELRVTFSDGSETTAAIKGARPDNDLAILKPAQIPDDLPPATLGSSRSLLPGDDVVVVGFPFGVGPSVSAGIVSGLNRQFRTRDEEPALKGLIQFDAAANPGNSGGPLINASGEVVGIVTAILNPTPARTFLGIGFAVTIEDAGGALGVPPF